LSAVGPLAGIQGEDVVQSEIIRAYFRALSRADWDGVAALCTDSVRYNLPAHDVLGMTIEGRAPFRRYTEELFSSFPGVVFELVDIASLSRGAISRYVSRWTSPSLELVQHEGAVLFHFQGDRIAEINVRLDADRLCRLLGPDAPQPRSLH
jgi:ketosteroid isomerase-like protein